MVVGRDLIRQKMQIYIAQYLALRVNLINASSPFPIPSPLFFKIFFKFYFIFKLYNIVLVLPNIEMNLPFSTFITSSPLIQSLLSMLLSAVNLSSLFLIKWKHK